MLIYFNGDPAQSMEVSTADYNSYWSKQSGGAWKTTATKAATPAATTAAAAKPATTTATPAPAAAAASSSTSAAAKTAATPTPTATVTTPAATTAKATTQPVARQAYVDDLYKKYFDRSATDAEYANWAQSGPQALEQYLGLEAKKYGYTSQFFKQDQQATIDRANAIIDADVNLTPEMKALAKQVMTSYKGGVEADAASILKTFADIKKTVIDPHYAGLVKQAETALKDTVSSEESARKLELETQGANATQAVEGAQGNLEQQGMTFSGKGVNQLGKASAYGGAAVPFGGQVPEGTVNANNRVIATTSQNRYMEQLKQAGRTAEQTLGTKGITGMLPGYAAVGGITGSIADTQQQEYGTTLDKIVANAEAKKKYLTDTQVSLT